MHAWFSVSEKKLTFAISSIHPTEKVSERTNRNVPARNTLVQLLALYVHQP